MVLLHCRRVGRRRVFIQLKPAAVSRAFLFLAENSTTPHPRPLRHAPLYLRLFLFNDLFFQSTPLPANLWMRQEVNCASISCSRSEPAGRRKLGDVMVERCPVNLGSHSLEGTLYCCRERHECKVDGTEKPECTRST